MPMVVDKTKDAQSLTNNVTLKVKSNSDNNNAMDANDAQVIKYLLEMHAKSQDQFAIATNNTMLKPTDVTNAELVNSQEMELMPDKMDNAKPFHNNVMLMVKSN
jgi:predicted component of type VI protein secretion system